jgi:hypothetical protein
MLLENGAQGGLSKRGDKREGTSICGIYISEADIGSRNIKTGQDRCIPSDLNLSGKNLKKSIAVVDSLSLR